jgi:hypothetical protein
MITKIEAIQSLRPDAEWNLRGDELEWLDTNQTKPTDAEINAEVTRLQAEYDAKQYQRDREAEYNKVGATMQDCIHALLDGGDTLTELQAKRTEVKNKYPKG